MPFYKRKAQVAEWATALRPAIQLNRAIPPIGFLLVLVACTCMKAGAQAQPTPAAMLPISITILYFDQSSELLRPGVKTTLDSLARLLGEQPALVATVTGYTDNIGKPELNLALAERRAKGVETYLKQRGVLANQITTRWEGPDKNPSPARSKAIPTIGRRVVVQLLPR